MIIHNGQFAECKVFENFKDSVVLGLEVYEDKDKDFRSKDKDN